MQLVNAKPVNLLSPAGLAETASALLDTAHRITSDLGYHGQDLKHQVANGGFLVSHQMSSGKATVRMEFSVSQNKKFKRQYLELARYLPKVQHPTHALAICLNETSSSGEKKVEIGKFEKDPRAETGRELLIQYGPNHSWEKMILFLSDPPYSLLRGGTVNGQYGACITMFPHQSPHISGELFAMDDSSTVSDLFRHQHNRQDMEKREFRLTWEKTVGSRNHPTRNHPIYEAFLFPQEARSCMIHYPTPHESFNTMSLYDWLLASADLYVQPHNGQRGTLAGPPHFQTETGLRMV